MKGRFGFSGWVVVHSVIIQALLNILDFADLVLSARTLSSASRRPHHTFPPLARKKTSAKHKRGFRVKCTMTKTPQETVKFTYRPPTQVSLLCSHHSRRLSKARLVRIAIEAWLVHPAAWKRNSLAPESRALIRELASNKKEMARVSAQIEQQASPPLSRFMRDAYDDR